MSAAGSVLEAEYEAALAQELAEVQREMEKCKADFASAERKDVRFKEDIKHNKTKAKKLTTKLAALQAELERTEAAKGEEETALPGLKAKAEEVVAAKARAEGEVEALYERMKAVIAPHQRELERKQTQLIPQRAKVNDAQHLLDATTNQLHLIQAKSATHDTAVRDLDQQLSTLTDTTPRPPHSTRHCQGRGQWP